ncbi:50S ribosomal protein L17 [Theileria orientalis strain Shintoku]|uniref:50S ribosomal protein L17 n=1 Tax=Theileria orientalis strain Shintoku TaxID=869250 RepID=J4C8Y6_THEOR|nr:50S ribosomal protein L17 [Theileria orientalis strain Shintoku]PVC50581.1 50S ribosomal protein L17 [Theileria orientalis]BAM41603.1 50S ribosomal protein L17 [Theileria orientalis strain Shintoku]|eukprot:XP_009691904.1 50S ribosomal protein L17 [Theileria orientalis strain Shintoku]
MSSLLWICIKIICFYSIFRLCSFNFKAHSFVNLSAHNSHKVGSFVLYGNLRTCKKLKRTHSGRRALLRALTTQVLRHGRIVTTFNKARQAKPRVERIIKYAKKSNKRHARILINSYLYDRRLTENVLRLAPERFRERHGGYCRIKRLNFCNIGDNSNRAILELLEY